MAINKTEFKDANQRARAMQLSGPTAQSVRYDGRSKRLIAKLNAGVELVFDPKLVQGLERASAAELRRVDITPSGLGLHFPLLDADVYLPALLEGITGSQSWIAAQMGRLGGSVKSRAKSKASRENGKLGGRPRRIAAS